MKVILLLDQAHHMKYWIRFIYPSGITSQITGP